MPKSLPSHGSSSFSLQQEGLLTGLGRSGCVGGDPSSSLLDTGVPLGSGAERLQLSEF